MADLIYRLKQNDAGAFREVYTKAFKVCARMVCKNSGNESDAKDVFQEALMVLLNHIRKPSFELKKKVEVYLYGIVRKLWLKQLNKRGKANTYLVFDEYGADAFDQGIDDSLEEKKRQDSKLEHTMSVLKNFGKEDCREVIKYFYFDNYSLRQIAELKGYSEKYAKKKKVNCMKYLRTEVTSTYKSAE